MVFSPDGRTLFTGTYDGDLYVWDIGGSNILEPIGLPISAHSRSLESIAIHHEESILAIGSSDNTISLWDISDPAHPVRFAEPFSSHTNSVERVIFSPTGERLISSSTTEIIYWNLDIGGLNDRACQVAGRNMTEDEWSQFLPPDVGYQVICPVLP
jgi:WD40 repeat protein